VLAVLVLVPLVSVLLVLALEASAPVAVAVALLSVSPAAPLMLRKAASVSGDADYAPGLQLVLAALSIATVPLSLHAITTFFPTFHVEISPRTVAGQVGRAQLLPLCAGIAIRAAFPGAAGRLARPLGRIAGVLLVLVAALVLLIQGKVLLVVGVEGYVAVAAAAGLSVLLGHLLGGPDLETRKALAVACALRNPGLALLVIQINFPGHGAGAVVLTYILVSGILIAAYGAWGRRASAR
jgi:BASS family bile acid:Na+ symporter